MSIRSLLLLVLSISALAGCTSIRPPAGGGAIGNWTDATGETWYAKNTYVLFFRVNSEVFYCDGRGTCKEAEMR